MYCFDQPSIPSTSSFFPVTDNLSYQPQITQPPLMHHQNSQAVQSYQSQPLILDYSQDLSSFVYYEEEVECQSKKFKDASYSPDSSAFSSTSSTASNYGDSTIKAHDLLSMSDGELEKLSIRQLNSVLAFGVSSHNVIF